MNKSHAYHDFLPSSLIFSNALKVSAGRRTSASGVQFEQQVRLNERERIKQFGSVLLPHPTQVSEGNTHVWVVTPATLAIDKTSCWNKQGSLSGVEFDACIVEHALNFPTQDTLLDCKNWADGGSMDIRALESSQNRLTDFADVKSKISSVLAQMNRQIIAASSLTLETKVPAHVEWIFSHSKTLTTWGQVLFRPHTVKFIGDKSQSLSWEKHFTELGDLPPEVQDLFGTVKKSLITKAVQSYSAVRPGSGTRKCDEFSELLMRTSISFRSFAKEH